MQRADPPEGCREATAAHRATWTRLQHTNPDIQEAARRQLRERLREPEELRARSAAQQRVRPSEASWARALQRLAVDRAGLATITPAAVPQRLDCTA